MSFDNGFGFRDFSFAVSIQQVPPGPGPHKRFGSHFSKIFKLALYNAGKYGIIISAVR